MRLNSHPISPPALLNSEQNLKRDRLLGGALAFDPAENGNLHTGVVIMGAGWTFFGTNTVGVYLGIDVTAPAYTRGVDRTEYTIDDSSIAFGMAGDIGVSFLMGRVVFSPMIGAGFYMNFTSFENEMISDDGVAFWFRAGIGIDFLITKQCSFFVKPGFIAECWSKTEENNYLDTKKNYNVFPMGFLLSVGVGINY